MNKIGRYWGLCIELAEFSRRYRSLFQYVALQTIRPYHSVTTTLRGVCITCHVHAEIQLLTFYENFPKLVSLKPRVLGVSKAACYLCNLFLMNHGQFFFTKTHGQLYHQWTVPDLIQFKPDHRNKYRRVLATMNIALEAALEGEKQRSSHQNRPYPLGSYLALPVMVPRLSQSPIPSTLSSSQTCSRTGIPGPEAVAAQAESRESTPRPILIERRSTPRTHSTEPYLRSISEPSLRSIRPDSSPSLHEPFLGGTSPEAEPNSYVALDIARKADLDVSSVSIESWQSLMERAISTTSPLQISSGNLSVRFEFDGPGTGLVTVTEIPKGTIETPNNSVDLGSMIPGESISMVRTEGDHVLTVNFNHNRSHLMQVNFQWPSNL